MDFVDIPFPRRLAFGAQSEAEWSTNVVITGGGQMSTNRNWTHARHRYDISLAVRTVADYQEVRAHFHSVRGRAKSFPFRDPLDYECTQATGVLIEAESTDSPTSDDWQLAKRYGTGADAWDRKITRPSVGVVIYRTRSSVVSVATATVSLTTGLVSIIGHLAGDTYTWTGTFDVPCVYSADTLPGVAIDRQPGGGALLVQCESIQLLEVRE